MPDKKGRLSPEERSAAIDWASAKCFKDHGCTLCGSPDWGIGEHVVQVPAETEGSLVLGGPAYPNVVIVCRNCGNTTLLNAIVLGLVKK